MDSVSPELNRDQILAQRVRVEAVEMPAWGGHVYVRQVPSSVWSDFGEQLGDKDRLQRIAIMAICDSQGNPQLTDADRALLDDIPGADLNRIAMAFFDLNGFSDNGRAELGKGLTETLGDTSPLLSVVNSESGTSTVS